MNIDITILLILAVIFVATLIRSAFGFGEALIAVPLLAFLMPVHVAAPVAVLVSITVAGVVVVQDWRMIDTGSVWHLILFTLIGTPIGLLVLISFSEAFVKATLAMVIAAFALYRLFNRSRFRLKNDRLAWVFGLGGGILGGAYGMNGPPLVAYGSLRQWSPERFRATLQGYFLPASAVAMTGYWLVGLWTETVTHYYLLSLPLVAVAIWLGRIMNRRMSGPVFLRYIYIGLLLVSILLLLQAFRS